jgi:hypothetical protein
MCAVLIPVAGHIDPVCDDALRELERRGYAVRRVRGFSAIDQGRCQMASDALAEGFQETLWIDADVGFHPDAVERVRAHNLPIVCGIYPKKGQRALAVHLLPDTPKLVFGREGGLVEVMYAGCGFLLVRREVYERMQEQLHLPVCNQRFRTQPLVPYFLPLLQPDGIGHWYLAEDYAFCERARRCGYKIMADTTIRLMHFGSYGYTWEDAGLEPKRYGTFHYTITRTVDGGGRAAELRPPDT